jgi:DNA polymerase-3 subunit alpha
MPNRHVSEINRSDETQVNKSHAVAYSMHSARTAWLSYYYPVEYMAATMNSYIGSSNGSDRIRSYIVACKKRGIDILRPSINFSQAKFTPEKGNIRFGLGSLRNMGAGSEMIIRERNARGEFKSYGDFLYRMGSYERIDKRMLQSLIYAGVLDDYEGTRQDKINAMEQTLKYIKKVKGLGNEQTSIFDVLDELNGTTNCERDFLSLNIPVTGMEMPKQELLSNEHMYAGFFISGHPLDEYEKDLAWAGTRNIGDLIGTDEDGEQHDVPRYTVRVAGVVRDLKKRISQKSNRAFYTFSIEDTTGTLKAVDFNKEGSDEKDEILQEGNVIMADGRLKEDNFGIQLTCNSVTSISSIQGLSNELEYCVEFTGTTEEKNSQLHEVKNFFKRRKGTQSVYSVKNGKQHVVVSNVYVGIEGIMFLQNIFGKHSVSPWKNA